MPTRLSIDALPAARRSARWREAVSDTFVRLDCRLDRRLPAHGTLEADAFGELRVARVRSSPQTVRRTLPVARAASDAWVLASVQLAGRTVVAQAGRQAVLRPGDVAFYDTARSYALTLPDDFDQMVLYLPRDAVERSVPGALEHVAERVPAAHPCARSLHALAPWLLGPGADGDGTAARDAAGDALRERAGAGAATLFTLALDALRARTADAAAPAPRARRRAAPPRDDADRSPARRPGLRPGEPRPRARRVVPTVAGGVRRARDDAVGRAARGAPRARARPARRSRRAARADRGRRGARGLRRPGRLLAPVPGALRDDAARVPGERGGLTPPVDRARRAEDQDVRTSHSPGAISSSTGASSASRSNSGSHTHASIAAKRCSGHVDTV